MEEIVIQAEHRKVICKKVKRLRREGKLPAIIYGRGVESIPIFLEGRMVNQVLPRVSQEILTRMAEDEPIHKITIDVGDDQGPSYTLE